MKMKKWMRVFAIILCTVLATTCFSFAAIAEETNEWFTAPVLIKAYEQSAGKIYIEWEGNAPLYQIYVDGAKRADVTVSHLLLDITKGTHTIKIYPVNDEKTGADSKLGVNVEFAETIGVGLDLDLAALGLDPKNLIPGYPSDDLYIDYKANPIIDGKAEKLSATTNPDNLVVLSFSDQFNADEYEIMIKKGNNANYVTYRTINEEDAALITKANSMVSILLDREFLAKQDCPIPDLDEEYKFSVLMRKYARDYVNGERIQTIIHSSKQSAEFAYKPIALWKTAPMITFASQTADGEITLQWEHDDYGVGCEYAVMQITKVLGVMTGEVLLGKTNEHDFTIIDLTNGDYCINIVPVYGSEKGSYSADANISVKNEWVVSPELAYEQTGDKQITLKWKAPANIEQYHIVVYTGDNNSLLRFVDLDYSKYFETDVDASEGNMEYVFDYDKEIDPENGVKIKFEVYGLRHTGTGAEQKSAVSSQSLILK